MLVLTIRRGSHLFLGHRLAVAASEFESPLSLAFLAGYHRVPHRT
jgi:hypothetical protein